MDAAARPLAWTRGDPSAAFPPRQALSAVSFKGRIWVLAGGNFSSGIFYNDVWSSADGRSWRLEKDANGGFSPRWGQSVHRRGMKAEHRNPRTRQGHSVTIWLESGFASCPPQ